MYRQRRPGAGHAGVHDLPGAVVGAWQQVGVHLQRERLVLVAEELRQFGDRDPSWSITLA
jgi:hypothetical protein